MASKANAGKYAAMARTSASRGSRRFVYNCAHDDRQSWPTLRWRQSDTPWRHLRAWTKLRWLMHDIRIFGAWESWKKFYYLIEAWRSKGEKIFAGMDELGNKYWYSHEGPGQGGRHGRFVEPADPHWFRGQDANCTPPAWTQWLVGNSAHTPAQMKARGEWGLHGRQNGGQTSFNYRWHRDLATMGTGIDPTYVPTTTMLVSPWYKLLKESGFSRFTNNWNPVHAPFMQPHDIKQEVVEDFYRTQTGFARWSKGHDHDEWRN